MKNLNRKKKQISVFSFLVCYIFMMMAPMALAAETEADADMTGDLPAVLTTAMDATVPELGVVDPLTPYTSTRLNEDVLTLTNNYPDIIQLEYIGQSELGKDIPLLKLGKGKRAVLWAGAMHSREVVTSAFLMLTAEEYANAYTNHASYGDYTAEKVQWLLEEFTIYIVPMTNPDGVDIVTDRGESNVTVSNRKTWKSNANGVNLNRNFPFDWAKNRNDVSNSNYLYYKGPSAGSEAETKALIALCESVPFEHLVSCHVMGKILYWRDNKNGAVPGDEALSKTISQITGYTRMPSTASAWDGWAGGFENWFRYRFSRPGICLEFAAYNTADSSTMAKFYTSDMVNWPKSKNLIFGVLNSLSNLTATPTTSTVYVNGEEIAFDSYYIAGNNYFKLRDIAYVLTETEKKFEVDWDGLSNTITLTGGLPYTPVGGEMEGKGPGVQKPVPTKSAIWLDGQQVYLKTCLIRGNNYFKLRDIGELFDFNISWLGSENTIVIETGETYTLD